jgi:hypothetical protein
MTFGTKLLKTKCIFWFSLHLLSETFLILRRIQRNIIIDVRRSSCKVPVIHVKFQRNLNFLVRFSKTTQIENLMKIHPVGAELFHVDGERRTDGHAGRQADRQTDRHDEANTRFSQFCEKLWKLHAARIHSPMCPHCAHRANNRFYLLMFTFAFVQIFMSLSGFSALQTYNFKHHFHLYNYIAPRTGNLYGSRFLATGVYFACFDTHIERVARTRVCICIPYTTVNSPSIYFTQLLVYLIAHRQIGKFSRDLTLYTPCVILTDNYMNKQMHVKDYKSHTAYKIPTCFSARAPPSRNPNYKVFASTNTTSLVVHDFHYFIVVTFQHFFNIIPGLLCWYLQTFGFLNPWRRHPGAETCRNLYSYFMYDFLSLYAPLLANIFTYLTDMLCFMLVLVTYLLNLFLTEFLRNVFVYVVVFIWNI